MKVAEPKMRKKSFDKGSSTPAVRWLSRYFRRAVFFLPLAGRRMRVSRPAAPDRLKARVCLESTIRRINLPQGHM